MMTCEFKILSSLEKVFFDKPTDLKEHTSGSMLKNEIYSFQLAGIGHDDVQQRLKFRVVVESELEPYISIKQIDYVPGLVPSIQIDDDDDYITKQPGLFPDPLHSIKDGRIELANHQTRSFWVSVEPNGEKVGTFPIVFKVYDNQERLQSEVSFNLEVIDAELPDMDMCNTGWFHGDCIAKLHNVEVLSEEYYEIVAKYIDTYVKFGHNMILTPIFTPPLDTAVGGERPTNQLVEVTLEKGEYSFGFAHLKRWIDMCKEHGIQYFEIAHLFTQWGAKHAPKIMATVDGEYRKIFGWETDSLSDEYRIFLDAFLPELVSFLKAEGVMEYCFFHVSDEPKEENAEQYGAAQAVMLPYIPKTQFVEAASSYSFYERGILNTPIVSNNHIHTYLEHGVTGLWTYYCMAQRKDVANRFLAQPSYRNRILGYQLYKYQIRGFLQWGFNFWFSQFSAGVINPYVDTATGGAFPSGDGFVVYPLDADGEVVCSLRLYVFNEGLQDMRAMKLLESLAGREAVVELLDEVEGFDKYHRNSQYILELREKINRMIQELL